jgi:hypothetical protein
MLNKVYESNKIKTVDRLNHNKVYESYKIETTLSKYLLVSLPITSWRSEGSSRHLWCPPTMTCHMLDNRTPYL